jgi:2-methylcitrate dehydratase PrpD
MERKQIVLIAATVTVFAWSVVMVTLGQAAAIAALAPALGLTVQQIVRAVRTPTTPTSGHRVVPVPDREGDTL